jgi:hypothetical protein
VGARHRAQCYEPIAGRARKRQDIRLMSDSFVNFFTTFGTSHVMRANTGDHDIIMSSGLIER